MFLKLLRPSPATKTVYSLVVKRPGFHLAGYQVATMRIPTPNLECTSYSKNITGAGYSFRAAHTLAMPEVRRLL